MRWLWLTPELARQMGEHALQNAPNEVCGLIGGRGGRAEMVVATANAAADPTRLYEIAPEALVAAIRQFDAAGLEMIGIFHSHPADPPAPSVTDVEQSYYPNTAYVIISLMHGEPELAAWTISDGQAQRLVLHVGHEPPDMDSGPLSQAQVTAILLSAIIAVSVFLLVAITLLPPAPRIP